MKIAFASLGFLLLAACVHKVQIEPSDKPFVVDLNIKIDHEIRNKIEKENQDLLNLEPERPKTSKKNRKGGKS